MAPGIEEPVLAAPPATLAPLPVKKQSPALFHHSLVTSDMSTLIFHAAASLQLQFGNGHDVAAKSDNLLIASPYNEPLHLLDLQRLDKPNQLLAKALTILKPIREDYATAPYTETFNWQDVFDFLKDLSRAEGYQWTRQRFYVVVFRSILLPTADVNRLHELDAHSHQEAMASGGLLKYWFGARNEKRENLATCIWRSRGDAHLGGAGPWHKKARGAARELYERIVFKTMELVIEDDVSGWKINDWVDEKVE